MANLCGALRRVPLEMSQKTMPKTHVQRHQQTSGDHTHSWIGVNDKLNHFNRMHPQTSEIGGMIKLKGSSAAVGVLQCTDQSDDEEPRNESSE